MWTRSLSKVVKGVGKEAIWERWSDVNSWHEWIPNVESTRLDKPFETGNSFTLKPKGSPAVTVRLLNVKRGQTFTGCTHFFGATLYDTHEIHQDPDGVRLTVTLKVQGPLGFLWRKLVGEKMEANLPQLLKNLASASVNRKPAYGPSQTPSSRPHPKLKVISSQPQKKKSKSSKTKKKTSQISLKSVKPVLETSASLTPKVSKPSIKKPTAKKSTAKKTRATKATAIKKTVAKTKSSTVKKGKTMSKSITSKAVKSKTTASSTKKAPAKGKAKTKTTASLKSQKAKTSARKSTAKKKPTALKTKASTSKSLTSKSPTSKSPTSKTLTSKSSRSKTSTQKASLTQSKTSKPKSKTKSSKVKAKAKLSTKS